MGGLNRSVVLVVDDDRDHLLMLEAVLESVGYAVVTAASCAEARALLEARPFDALLADLSLGDGTALDLLAGLADEHRPRVALVLSGFDATEDVDRSLHAGFDAHLVKPTAIDQLRDALEQGLTNHPSGFRVARAQRVDVAAAAVDAPDGGTRRR